MFKWFCWHKWKRVYKVYQNKFLDETYKQLIKEFRICEKCGKAQEWCATYDGVSWETLNPAETEILKRKIIDKGNYYVLKS